VGEKSVNPPTKSTQRPLNKFHYYQPGSHEIQTFPSVQNSTSIERHAQQVDKQAPQAPINPTG
jgi:hypothetical protein